MADDVATTDTDGIDRVLNLYAGIGGNRKLWSDVDVTAVEVEQGVADYYQKQFPDDTVVVADAHEYLKENYESFDFIWASPPCQTHSQLHKISAYGDSGENKNREPDYPDMRLYQEIIFLEHFADCDYVVENVQGYYDPLIEPQTVDRHYIWSNFHISDFETPAMGLSGSGTTQRLEDEYGFDLSDADLGIRKDQAIANCVHPELGFHILNEATKNRQSTLSDL
jgi:DNA (cytosine-5)-methyltransferase 1